jgi:type IV pilus assembly protein PilA
VVVYVDVAGLLKSPLFASFVPTVLALAGPSLEPKQKQCLEDSLKATRELLIGTVGDDELTLLRFDEGVASPATCLGLAAIPASPLPGAPDSYELKGMRLVHLPGLIMQAPDATATKAIAQTAAGQVGDGVRLADGQYAAWKVKVPGLGQGHGELVASEKRFRIATEGDVPEGLARRIESEVNGARAAVGAGAGMPPEQAALLTSLLKSLSVTRAGGHIGVAFDLEEPPIEQARDLGTAASLAIYGVRRYLANAKMAEARNVVAQVARDYAAWWDKEQGPPTMRAGKPVAKLPTKLIAFPAVPKTVPRGVKYQSTEADWKPWGPLAFSMDMPQYYQYEVTVAKDGKSGDILAHGDLNGDGKPSTFRLHLTVHPKDRTLTIAPTIEETDPEE